MTLASDAIKALVAYSSNLYMDAGEERAVLNQLRSDTDFNRTIIEVNAAGLLSNMLERISPKNGMELVQVLGGKLPNPMNDILLDVKIKTYNYKGAPPRGGTWSRGTWSHIYQVSRDLQANIKRLGLVVKAAPFTSPSGVVGSKPTSAFSGSGATGVSPSVWVIGPVDSVLLAGGHDATVKEYSNPLGSLPGYLAGLSATTRTDQAKILMGLPISTVLRHSYIGWVPSRKQVTEAAAKVHNLQPALVAAFLLAEQRDQTENEDAKDFDAAVSIMSANTSIGLGQVVISTARRSDLFADLLSPVVRKGLRHDEIAYLLASDEFNIFAAARYLRLVADEGARKPIAALPATKTKFPGIVMTDYARNSKDWPEDNIRALGSEYTSRAWDDKLSPGWGDFVFEAFQDVKAAGVF